MCTVFFTWLFDSPSYITCKLINVHCVTLLLWKQQHPVGGIHVHGCMDAWYKARNMSSFWGRVGVKQILFDCICGFLFCEEARYIIPETSHLSYLKILLKPLTARWSLLNCTNYCWCFIFYIFKGIFPFQMILTFWSATFVGMFHISHTLFQHAKMFFASRKVWHHCLWPVWMDIFQ